MEVKRLREVKEAVTPTPAIYTPFTRSTTRVVDIYDSSRINKAKRKDWDEQKKLTKAD